MNTVFHEITAISELPNKLNNPFCYEPHPLCLKAADEVRKYVDGNHELMTDAKQGKMFGVLIVQNEQERIGYLAAYSGLLAGRNDHDFFVPPVFNATQPDGYFKMHESEISALNRQINLLQQSERYLAAIEKKNRCIERCHQEEEFFRLKMKEAKARRNSRRNSDTPISAEEDEMMTRESQFLKAELRRLRRRNADLIATNSHEADYIAAEIDKLKSLRLKQSDHLQHWLFCQYDMLNSRGERQNLCEIFAHTPQQVPPSGAGDCCAPKLLQHAYLNSMRPISIAEFWYGASPHSEVRLDGTFYPACRGKCLPILTFMLQGLEVEEELHEGDVTEPIEIVYEDEWITVVNKPAGMKSVPGRESSHSVLSVLSERAKGQWQPIAVHRLDMDTSGLLVVAHNMAVCKALQRQFTLRAVKKRYVALLDGVPNRPRQGRIDLPLSSDPLDRPYQKIDTLAGKAAITDYKIINIENGRTRIALTPLTGRTHQLRIHCAHTAGLGTPIIGDRLYGHKGSRLYLHAEMLTFIHPMTGNAMTFERKENF